MVDSVKRHEVQVTLFPYDQQPAGCRIRPLRRLFPSSSTPICRLQSWNETVALQVGYQLATNQTLDEDNATLYGNNNTAITRFCRYSLIPYANKPQIHVRNYPELLLTNFANFTAKCGSKNKTVCGCRTCIYVLESGCSVIAKGIFISGQRTKISGHTNESVVYSLNRAIVRAMLNETSFKTC